MPAPDEVRAPPALARRLGAVLAFVHRVVDELDGPAPAGAFAAGERTHGLAVKVVAEVALLLHAVAPLRASHAAIAASADALAARLAPLARADAVCAAVCLQPAWALDHAMAHVLLSDLGIGLDDGRFDALLRESLRVGRDTMPERLPHRRLEHDWLERLWPAGEPDARARAAALAASALGRPLDALAPERDGVYAFTHALLYATDAGARPSGLRRPRAAIAADALAALGFALDTDDHDLCTEVLWTWPMLGLRWPPAALLAFDRLARVHDALGFLPGRAFDAARAGAHGTTGPEHDRHVLATTYHATIVLGILCATALRPGRGPAPVHVPVSASTRVARAGRATRALLDDADPRNAWLVEAQRSSDADGLAPLLLAVALRRAAGRTDLAALHAALVVARTHALDDGPAPVQAAALLRRATLLAGQAAGATGAAGAAEAADTAPAAMTLSRATSAAR